MAYRISTPRAGVNSYSLSLTTDLKAFTTAPSYDKSLLEPISAKTPTFAKELQAQYVHGPGKVLCWMTNGLNLVALDAGDMNSPANIAEHRRRERAATNNAPLTPFNLPSQAKVANPIPYNRFGEDGLVVHTFSKEATVEFLSALNQDWIRTRVALLRIRVDMDARVARDFDDPTKTNFNEIINALRFIVVGTYVLKEYMKVPVAGVSALKQYLCTANNITFSQLVMTGSIDEFLVSVMGDCSLDMLIVREPLLPSQFRNMPNHDSVSCFTALRQPGCVTETRIKLSGGLFLSSIFLDSSSPQLRESVRNIIADKLDTLQVNDDFNLPLDQSQFGEKVSLGDLLPNQD